jgi:hypothetical protein
MSEVKGDQAVEFPPELQNTTVKILPKKEHFGANGKKLCSFGGTDCTQSPVHGHEFCIKHILQDPNAPFKQCSFITKQGKKRCTNALSTKQEDTRYCNTHKQSLGFATKAVPAKEKKKKAPTKKDDSDTEPEPTLARKRLIPMTYSDTESDAPTSDDEFKLATPTLHQYRYTPTVTDEVFLKMRKERIETLLNLYYGQYKRLKVNLKGKYTEFVKQRERVINGALNTKDIKVKVVQETPIGPSSAIFSVPTRQTYKCTRTEKHNPEGEILCYYNTCTNRRLMCCDFCFTHILFDTKQRLYTAGPGGELDPVMIGVTGEAKEDKKRKSVLIEEPRKKKKPTPSEDKEKVSAILNAIPKVQNLKL